MEYRHFRYQAGAGEWRSGLASIALAEDIDIVGADRNYPFVARFNCIPIGFYRTLDKAIGALERFSMNLRLVAPFPPDAPTTPENGAHPDAEETDAAATNSPLLLTYCMTCKQKMPMSSSIRECNAKGKPAAKGPCAACGRILYRLLGAGHHQGGAVHAAA